MAIELMCRKIGMTRVFDEAGTCISVTVLDASPNVVVQKKTLEKDGYSAIQLGFGERRPNLFDKPRRGHFEKPEPVASMNRSPSTSSGPRVL